MASSQTAPSARGSGCFLLALAALTMLAPATPATPPPPRPENPMIHHARGTFEVKLAPLSPPPAPGLARYSINKDVHGDLEATTQGEMYAGGDVSKGAAGYVAIEVVTGKLEGRAGSFALQHSGTIEAGVQKLSIVIVPGSGTGALTGIAGTFDLQVAQGQHSYVLTYTLPQ
jgi:Protein of unknown function (DUF3224)